MLQELDFSQCPLRQDLFAEDVRDFLDSDTFPSLTVGRSTILGHVSAFLVGSVKPTHRLSR
jgi:hypothetical protein